MRTRPAAVSLLSRCKAAKLRRRATRKYSSRRCALVQDSAKELGIELLFLPSYSPNLNLIERLWKFVKKEVLNSRHHQDFKKFQEAIDGCLAEIDRGGDGRGRKFELVRL